MTSAPAPTALLVYTHPERTSLGAALRDQAVRPLVGTGWSVDLSPLRDRIHGDGRAFESGLLQGKHARQACTTDGPQPSCSKGGRHGDLGVLPRSVHPCTVRYTGMESLEPLVAWAAGSADDVTRQEYLDAFGSRMARVASAGAAAASSKKAS